MARVGLGCKRKKGQGLLPLDPAEGEPLEPIT